MVPLLGSVFGSIGFAQQSVHPTLGSLANSQAVFYALLFSQSDGVPPPAPARVTQTVGRLMINHHQGRILGLSLLSRVKIRQKKGKLAMSETIFAYLAITLAILGMVGLFRFMNAQKVNASRGEKLAEIHQAVRFDNFPLNELSELVFEKEPLHNDEKIIACWDSSLGNHLTTGMLLTNQALIKWDKKKVERFDFSEMSDITLKDYVLHSQDLSFTYKGNKMSLTPTSEKGFSNAIQKAISEVTEINKKYVEYFPSIKSLDVPMVDNKLSVYFPNKCIYCGGFAETTKSIKVTVSDKYSSQRGQVITTRTLSRSINISVPYCQNHAELSKQNEATLYRLFGYGLLLGLLIGFIIILSQTTLGDFLSTTFSSFSGFMWGSAFTIAPAIAGGFLLMWSPKVLPFLFKNKTLRHQPSFFSHHGGDLGINLDFSKERDTLRVEFANLEIAQEFAYLNNAKTKNWLGKEIK